MSSDGERSDYRQSRNNIATSHDEAPTITCQAPLPLVGDQHDEVEQPRRKRRKVRLACGGCRDRKTRCDGVRPTCGPCQRRKMSLCVYQEDTAPKKGYVTQLERRLRALEELRPTGDSSISGNGTFSETGSLASSKPIPVREENSAPNSVSAISLGENSTASSLSLPRKGDSSKRRWSTMSQRRISHNVDAMVAVPFTSGAGDGFFGNSSSVAFAEIISNRAQYLVAGGQIEPNRIPFSDSNFLKRPFGRDPDIRLTDINDLDLPQRRVGDNLVYSYFDTVHPLYPLIHKQTFMTSYEDMWTATKNHADSAWGIEAEDSRFYIMLNLVFAMGCPFSVSILPEERASRANKFYERSKRALSFDVLEADSLISVQILLLTSLYLQSTNHAHKCWNTVGLAIRAAQGLGLHLDEVSSRWPQNQLERQMRRRIWHICVSLDRVLAMTFGRPTMTTRNWTVEFPELIDDEYLVDNDAHPSEFDDVQQPVSVRPRIGCFIYTLKLFDIMDDILSAFYGIPDVRAQNRPQDHRLSNLDFTTMVELDRRLNDFEATLPPWLTPPIDQESLETSIFDCYALQVNVLRARFLHTRLLLLRPVLLEYIQKDTLARSNSNNPILVNQNGLNQQFYVHASNRCVATVHEIIAHLHANINSPAQPAPWYVVYFTLTAATTLIAAKSCPNLSTDIVGTTFDVSWDRCTDILRHLEGISQSAVQGVVILKSLYERVCKSLQPDQTLYGDAASVGGGDNILENPTIQSLNVPMDGYGPTGPNLSWPSDGFILRNPLTGEDWLRNSSLNLDWLDLEPQDTTYLDN